MEPSLWNSKKKPTEECKLYNISIEIETEDPAF